MAAPRETLIKHAGVRSKVIIMDYLIPEEMVKYLSKFYAFKRWANVPTTLPTVTRNIRDYFMDIRRHL